MKMITGLLAIVAGTLVFNSAFAVPRYSASVPQVSDSPNAVAAQQVDSKMNNERGGVEKEITVDAIGVAANGGRQGKAQSSDAQTIQNAGSGHDPPISPKYGLIPAANIREYPHTDTYLDLSDADVSHYFILKEDYVFQNLDGRLYNIPAGFIWDGASIAKWLGAVPGLLEVGNTRYNSALAEGLIHDYMYRNPQQFTKKESDDLFYENLKRNNNLNPKVMSAGVKVFGGRAYLGHAFNRISHEYWFDKLPDFYANNLKLYHRSQEEPSSSAKQKAKDMLLGVRKNPLEENVCHADSVSVNELKAMNGTDANSENLAGEEGVCGWCDCGDDNGKRYIVGDMLCMYGKLECDLAYTLCGRCGCVVRPKDCVGEGLQIVDVRLYKELKQKSGGKLAWSDAFKPLKARQSKIEAVPNGQIVVGGRCVCKVADPIKVGFTNKITGEFYVCCTCGRVREPDENGGIPNGPTALSEMGLNEMAEKETKRIRNWLEEGKSSK